MARRVPSPRTLRRANARAAAKVAQDRERLARLEPGGDPARPLDVESASQVEPHALALACLRCAGSMRLEEHAVETVDDQRLRVVRLRCPRCGSRRGVWFRIAPERPN